MILLCTHNFFCVLIKGDQRGTKLFLHEEKPIALLPGVKTEPKEEPLTLEGEPHMHTVTLLSATPVTKAETMSAPGMSTHSITTIICS